MLKIYPLLLALTAVWATEPKPEYQLELKVQQVCNALVNGDSRTIYRLFVPAFRREIPFARFDSAVRVWHQNRRINRIQPQVVDTRGRGAHVSTYLRFAGEEENDYLYQNWLFSDSGWQLVWISNILNPTFQFGSRDTPAMRQLALAALEQALSYESLKRIRVQRLKLPDTLYILQPLFPPESLSFLRSRPVRWLSAELDPRTRLPRTIPYFLQLGQLRIFGTLALAVVDFYPVSPAGRSALRRYRSLEFYLRQEAGNWVFDSFGKIW
ncbi:MAG: hypothetical protein ABIK54_04140 [candidate division WOR-3 bacterium]